MNSIRDCHLKWAIAAQASQNGDDMQNMLLSDIRNKMGQNAMFFSCFNPNGRYRLDLSIPVQRDVAKYLVAINKKVNAKIVAKECADRSQNGNQSCFRNERINGVRFVMHVGSWRIPTTGLFEFDFQCFDMQPSPFQLSDSQDILLLLEWFEKTAE